MDVVFKLLIDNIELVDYKFILPNIVVLVAFKLSKFNLVKVDKLLKLVLLCTVICVYVTTSYWC